MKRLIYILVFVMVGAGASAQQEAMISQYMFNGLMLNPAYAGSHDYFSTSVLHRSQWVQFDNAPVTQVFSIDGPIADDRLGIGLNVVNDRLGIVNQLDFGTNIAVKFPLKSGTLSFGLRADIISYSARLSDVIVQDVADPVYSSNDIQGQFATQFAFGAYYHADNWYAGLGIPNLYSLDDNISVYDNPESTGYFVPHYFVNGGMVFSPSFNLDIKPSILVKVGPAAPVEIDLNCNFLLYKRLWLGAGYRTGDALVGILEYQMTPQLRAGYAYDWTLTDISDYSKGSHEVMIGYDFGKDIAIKKRSPRYF